MEKYKLEISQEHLRIIAAALNEVQFRLAFPVMESLRNQIEEIDRKNAGVVLTDNEEDKAN